MGAWQVIFRADFLNLDGRPGGLHCYAYVAAPDRETAIAFARQVSTAAVAGMGRAVINPPRLFRASREPVGNRAVTIVPGVMRFEMDRRGPFAPGE